MKHLRIKCIDVFTSEPFCGNPAGVILDAGGLTGQLMQEIASSMRMNIIETGYIMPSSSEKALHRIRFFTPKKELSISGHVTIAASYALVEEGRIPLNDGWNIVHFETMIGNVPVEILCDIGDPDESPGDGGQSGMVLGPDADSRGVLRKIMMRQPVHTFHQSPIPIAEIAAVLDISEAEITRTGLPVVTARHDMDWLIIPVERKEAILNMNPDLIKLGMLNRNYGVQTNHIFTLDSFSDDCITYSRHFGPAMGFWEDPASAMASGGLGTYLLKYGVTSSCSMQMQQGKEIASLAKILVELDRDADGVTSVRVGGLAVTSITQEIDVERGAVPAAGA